MVKLTTNQTLVLKDGAQTLANITEDPVRNVLGLVASYAPEINILKRRFPLAAAGLPPKQQILGMDAILDQFTRDARIEAVKYGIKAGIVGAGVGAVMHGVGDFIGTKRRISRVQQLKISTSAYQISTIPPYIYTRRTDSGAYH